MIPKFRAWLRNVKRIEIVMAVHYQGMDVIVEVPMDGGVYGETSSFTVGRDCDLMQSIGVKDSNRIEMSRGDLVRVCGDDGEYSIHEIRYFADDNYPAFDLYPHVDCECNGISYYLASGRIEVIGNIYHNPNIRGGGDE